MKFGDNLIKLRENMNLTQQELAEKIGVSPKTISSYERNKSLPNIEVLILLSNVFDTSVDKIIGLNKTNKEEISREYKKKNLKNNLINYILLGSIFIVPLLFFLYVGYISISAVGANVHVALELTNEESAKIIPIIINAWYVFKIMAYEYIIYCILLLLNYIFYKKEYKLLLLIFNIIVLIVFIIDFISNLVQNGIFYNYDLFIFVISSLIGLYYAYKLYKIEN